MADRVERREEKKNLKIESKILKIETVIYLSLSLFLSFYPRSLIPFRRSEFFCTSRKDLCKLRFIIAKIRASRTDEMIIRYATLTTPTHFSAPRFQHFWDVSIPTHEWTSPKCESRGTLRRIMCHFAQWLSDVRSLLFLSLALSRRSRGRSLTHFFLTVFTRLAGLPRKSSEQRMNSSNSGTSPTLPHSGKT